MVFWGLLESTEVLATLIVSLVGELIVVFSLKFVPLSFLFLICIISWLVLLEAPNVRTGDLIFPELFNNSYDALN